MRRSHLRVPGFPALGQGLKSGNNPVVRAIQFLTAGSMQGAGARALLNWLILLGKVLPVQLKIPTRLVRRTLAPI
jgi:hypothetical protein